MSAPSPGRPTVRWTWLAFLLVGAGGSLIVLAVAYRDAVPLFAGIPLLLAPFLAGAQGSLEAPRADLVWLARGLGPEVAIDGVLRAPFGRSAVAVSVQVPRPAGVLETSPPAFERDATSIRFHLRWRLTEPAILTLSPPRVLWHDPLGLTERPLDGERPPLRIERYPPSLYRLGAIQLARTTTLPGEIHSRARGASGEFFGLREAGPGEPPRSINWRATARAGHLLMNEYRIDRTGDLLVLLDVRPTSLGLEVDERLLSLARAAAYGIAEALLRAKSRVGFASFGEFLTTVPLSTGRIHRVRLLRAIQAARREEIAGPAMRCALGLRRLYPRGVTTLVLSAWTEDPLFNLVPYIQRQGFPVVLLSPSPLPMRAGTGGLEAADEPLAVRLERLERRTRLSELWLHAPVVDWEDFWTLEPLARILRRPSYRRAS